MHWVEKGLYLQKLEYVTHQLQMEFIFYITFMHNNAL